ncbi:MAG: ABC transporter ATP-binding protein [Solirubrobacterales bacterium]|nr:ABC transporter ATP-binding protein [Solirubrobacterales bacterium]
MSPSVKEAVGAGTSRGPGTVGRISLAGIVHSYGREDAPVIDGLSLAIEPGEFVCLVGPSGCGKTTLLKLIAGFEFPEGGQVVVDGATVDRPGGDRAVVFQHSNLFPWLSVRGNVELGPKLAGTGRAERREISDRLLEMVGLGDAAEKKIWELSGGMQQRCSIARALATDPSIILMDEPFGALDAITRERLQDEILEIWRESRSTIVFVTHGVDEALYLGTRVVVMGGQPGRILLDLPIGSFGAETGGDVRRSIRDSTAFLDLKRKVRDTIGNPGKEED